MRFPRFRTWFARRIWRLPRSHLRRAVVRRTVKLAWEAFNRGDLEVTFALYHPECDSHFPPELATIGLPSGTRRRDERVRVQQSVLEEWRKFWFELDEYIDVGDGRLLTVGRMRGIGLKSGVTVDTEWVAVFTTLDGQVVREDIFIDRRRALESVGLPLEAT